MAYPVRFDPWLMLAIFAYMMMGACILVGPLLLLLIGTGTIGRVVEVEGKKVSKKQKNETQIIVGSVLLGVGGLIWLCLGYFLILRSILLRNQIPHRPSIVKLE